jgi:hypothetical protein
LANSQTIARLFKAANLPFRLLSPIQHVRTVARMSVSFLRIHRAESRKTASVLALLKAAHKPEEGMIAMALGLIVAH